jgi:hypothetical protein
MVAKYPLRFHECKRDFVVGRLRACKCVCAFTYLQKSVRSILFCILCAMHADSRVWDTCATAPISPNARAHGPTKSPFSTYSLKCITHLVHLTQERIYGFCPHYVVSHLSVCRFVTARSLGQALDPEIRLPKPQGPSNSGTHTPKPLKSNA